MSFKMIWIPMCVANDQQVSVGLQMSDAWISILDS